MTHLTFDNLLPDENPNERSANLNSYLVDGPQPKTFIILIKNLYCPNDPQHAAMVSNLDDMANNLGRRYPFVKEIVSSSKTFQEAISKFVARLARSHLSVKVVDNTFMPTKEMLKKAINKDSFTKNISRPSLIEGQKTVDHTPHVSSEMQPYFQEIMNDHTQLVHSNSDGHIGSSDKMILKHPESEFKFMIKPYHANLNQLSGDLYHPIAGWATMTMRNLYRAADSSHLSEDVNTHLLTDDKIPCTVHAFGPGSTTLVGSPSWSNVSKNINQDDVRKAVVINFLANHWDTHAGNIVVDDTKEPSKFLFIDHERAFQYPRTSEEFGIHQFAKRQGFSATDKIVSPTEFPQKSKHFTEWWDKCKQKIKASFEADAEHIKDKRVKKHLITNFNQRYNMLDKAITTTGDDWVEHIGKNYSKAY
jgi:hypothetical protein